LSPSNIKSRGMSYKYRNFIRTNIVFFEKNIKKVLNTFIMHEYISCVLFIPCLILNNLSSKTHKYILLFSN
jgi:hypothetical protein